MLQKVAAAERAPRANQLPTNLMLMKGLDVLGCPAVISAQKDPSLRTERNRVLSRWIEEGLVRPHIAQTYPLEDVRSAASKMGWKNAWWLCAPHTEGASNVSINESYETK